MLFISNWEGKGFKRYIYNYYFRYFIFSDNGYLCVNILCIYNFYIIIKIGEVRNICVGDDYFRI